ncbi:HNH endonuclease [Methylobacterium fujisawaense]|jgi:hypothetical protein|uniref:HNH endonuclease n=1 Tax=Methylobacterium fujisawaense TaxID=107400 RepID=UPI003D03937E
MSGDGYGLFDRRREGKRFARRAHRVAYELAHGPLPAGLMVRHKCDNPRCCNPSHLEPGTAAENSRDMVERGRHWTLQRPTEVPRGSEHWTARNGTAPLLRGQDHPSAKLTAEMVREIRAARDVPQRELARRYGVSQGAIWQVLRGNHWSHVS